MRRSGLQVAPRSFEIVVTSPEDTDRLAEIISRLCRPGDLFALIGPLGAGKTRFTQALFKALGAVDYVRSPSFTLVNEYDGSLPLAHMDLYRLTDPDDLEDLGYEDHFYGSGVVAVEWADRASGYLPENTVYVEIHHVPGEEFARSIKITGSSIRAQEIIAGVIESWRSLR
jgi:tRNA threonylcarbamoyladenosine biosynthesis protein TsaE